MRRLKHRAWASSFTRAAKKFTQDFWGGASSKLQSPSLAKRDSERLPFQKCLRSSACCNSPSKISEYLNFTLRNPNQPHKKITVRMLACHTSSIRDGKIYSIPPDKNVEEFFKPSGEFWEGGVHFAQEAVGEFFTYCNLNYGLLGTIIEEKYFESTRRPRRLCARQFFAKRF